MKSEKAGLSAKDAVRQLTTIVPLVGGFVVLVCGVYLYSFWSSFNLNVFEYLSVRDLPAHAIYPLFTPLLFFVLVILFLEGGVATRRQARHNTPSSSVVRLIGKWLCFSVILSGSLAILLVSWFRHAPLPQTIWLLLFLVAVVLWGLFSLVRADTRIGKWLAGGFVVAFLLYMSIYTLFSPEPYDWFYISILVPVVVFSLFLRRSKYIEYLYLNPKTRVILLLVLYAPALAFYNGKFNASQAKQGKGTLFVDLSKSTSQLPVGQNHHVSYLARFGDAIVLYDTAAHRLIIVRNDKLETLVLMPAGMELKNNSTWTTH
jgi:hypothetical protein